MVVGVGIGVGIGVVSMLSTRNLRDKTDLNLAFEWYESSIHPAQLPIGNRADGVGRGGGWTLATPFLCNIGHRVRTPKSGFGQGGEQVVCHGVRDGVL